VSIIMWDKPRQKMSKAKWKDDVGFEDGPTGGYQPNMSEYDANRWKGKLVGTKTGFPQVEIRKKAGASLMTIIVNLGDGYNYKYYSAIPKEFKNLENFGAGESRTWMDCVEDAEYFDFADFAGSTTSGTNVHISMNGPATLCFQEIAELTMVIHEAKAVLEDQIGPGVRHSYVAYYDGDATTFDAINAVAGAKAQFDLKNLKIIAFTATYGAVGEIKKIASVIDVISRDEALIREEEVYEARHP
jgi:hypothetical protein